MEFIARELSAAVGLGGRSRGGLGLRTRPRERHPRNQGRACAARRAQPRTRRPSRAHSQDGQPLSFSASSVSGVSTRFRLQIRMTPRREQSFGTHRGTNIPAGWALEPQPQTQTVRRTACPVRCRRASFALNCMLHTCARSTRPPHGQSASPTSAEIGQRFQRHTRKA
jgi:hypothetical protein